MAGYSGTPLSKKLGIKEGSRIFLTDAPKHYMKLLAPLPKRVQFTPRLSGDTDIVHLFATERTRLADALRVSLESLRPEAMIWVSWPKKSSRVQTDITEDTVRALALPMGLVDVKVCALDDTWSGLKLVLRKENRRARTASPAGLARARAKAARR